MLCSSLPLQFPMISEFGEDRNSYCSFESKENALLQSENGNLQQRVNALTHEVRHLGVNLIPPTMQYL